MKRPTRPRHHKFRGLGAAGLHDLHAVAWGRSSSPRVAVCAHGYSGNGRDFDVLARELSRKARVLCPDFAGRGDSAWLSSYAYHLPQLLADARTMLAGLGVREIDWVGTSMGGLLGLMLAAQAGTPVRRLVMNDVGAYLPLEALKYIARNLDAPASFATLADVEAHLRHTHREWGEITDEQWRHLAKHHARRAGKGYRLHYDPQIAQVSRPLPFTPGIYFWDAWYRVRCPVLLIRGEHSAVFPADVARAMVAIKPSTQLLEVPGCGHAPALMSADQVAAVAEFLAEPRGPAAVTRGARNAQERLHPPRAA